MWLSRDSAVVDWASKACHLKTLVAIWLLKQEEIISMPHPKYSLIRHRHNDYERALDHPFKLLLWKDSHFTLITDYRISLHHKVLSSLQEDVSPEPYIKPQSMVDTKETNTKVIEIRRLGFGMVGIIRVCSLSHEQKELSLPENDKAHIPVACSHELKFSSNNRL